MSRSLRSAASLASAALAITVAGGCGKPSEAPPPSVDPKTPAPPAPPSNTAAPPADGVKIMAEYWEGTNKIKFRYEMRKGADGRYARNGFSQAFYLSGIVEREGNYHDNQRVGVWKYYDTEGKLLRTEDRKDGKFPQGPLTTPPEP